MPAFRSIEKDKVDVIYEGLKSQLDTRKDYDRIVLAALEGKIKIENALEMQIRMQIEITSETLKAMMHNKGLETSQLLAEHNVGFKGVMFEINLDRESEIHLYGFDWYKILNVGSPKDAYEKEFIE